MTFCWQALALLALVDGAQLGSKKANWWPSFGGSALPEDVQALVSSSGDEALPLKAPAVPVPHSPVVRPLRAVSPGAPTAPAAPAVPSMAPVAEYDEVSAPSTAKPSAAQAVLSALIGLKLDPEAPEEAESNEAAAAAPPPAPRRVRTVPAAARALPALLRVSAGNRPDPLAQCLEFARWAKKKKIQGKELTKLFMSTCSAGAGAAPKKYVEMCQGVESVVTVLERQEDWIPAQACDLLLTHFRKRKKTTIGGMWTLSAGVFRSGVFPRGAGRLGYR
ncbi:unnamed protein product [Durusdinium trenchii]|uniref:Uncharacterized protein n=1 Tax=Durusdinium trenchii TaxID=1381693 RepID=A0ABP0SC19_9DINO